MDRKVVIRQHLTIIPESAEKEGKHVGTDLRTACGSGIHVEYMREFVDHTSFVHSRSHQSKPRERPKFIHQLVDIGGGEVLKIDFRVFGIGSRGLCNRNGAALRRV